MQFGPEQVSKNPLTILKHAQKVLIPVPKVKPFPMEQIILKVSQIMLVFWKNLQPEPIPPSILKRSKINIALNINPMRVRYKCLKDFQWLEAVVEVEGELLCIGLEG